MPNTIASRRRPPASAEIRHTAPEKQTGSTLMPVLVGTAVYLYLNLFALPLAPILLGGDQVFVWLNAQHMLEGRRIFQDFLQFTAPGADLVYFTLFKLFGFRIWVTNAAVLALGVAFSWICFSLASDIMRRSWALLTTALFLALVYGKALNATHHWFSMLAIAGAVKIAFKKISPLTLALSGSLLGVATFFNQTHGPAALLAFAVFLFLRRSRTKTFWKDLLRDQALLFLGFALTLLLLSAHYIAAIGLRQLWYFQVTYVTKYVVDLTQGSRLGLSRPLTLHTLPALAPYLIVYLLLPVTYLLSFGRCWRERHNPAFPWDRIALLTIVGIVLLVEVSMSLNWLRLFAMSLPGIILLGAALDRATTLPRRTLTLIWIAVLALAARQTIVTARTQSLQVRLPGGLAATTPQTFYKLQFIMQRTTPGDFFFQAGWPGMYLPLQLKNPLYRDTAYAARPDEAEQAVQQLEAAHVPLILWTQHLDATCSPDRPCEDNLAALRNYLHANYTCIQVFPDGDTLWQRTE
jgi:hypothetical protein